MCALGPRRVQAILLRTVRSARATAGAWLCAWPTSVEVRDGGSERPAAQVGVVDTRRVREPRGLRRLDARARTLGLEHEIVQHHTVHVISE